MTISQERATPRVRLGEWLASTGFVLPNLVFYTLFMVLPAVSGVALSFFKWRLLDTPTFVGLSQYEKLLADDRVLPVIWRTAEYLVLGVVPTVLIGFLLAVLSNWNAPGIRAIRVLYFLPLVVSTSVAGLLWARMFDARFGVVNTVLSTLGLPKVAWLGETSTALPALTAVVIWLSLPIVVVLYLAGLQRIPTHVYEAATLDGAGPWRRTWTIAWPMVAPTTALVVGIELLQFLSLPFEVSLIMTDGGPLSATEPLSLYAYHQAFGQRDIGYASALSTLQFGLVLAVALIALGVFRVVRRRDARTR